jgi:polysaccharide biosynthesis/export protein
MLESRSLLQPEMSPQSLQFSDERRMSRFFTMRLFSGLTLLLATSLAGCTSSPGGFTLFPSGNFLLRTTEQLRDQASPAGDLPRELAKTVLDTYIVQPGDVLLIEPDSLDSPIRFPADQTVMPDGTIDLGRFGRRVVAGKSIEEIEAEVQELIRAGQDKKTQINARLITPRSAVYYVLGEVNSPGAFPLVGRETVLDGLIAAGGVSSRASTCNIILSRPTEPNSCRVVLPICYRHITQLGDTATNYQLKPGDRIYVATRTFCEQLAFWKAKDDCEFCCACQSACPGGHPPFSSSGVTPAARSVPQPAQPRSPESMPAPDPFLDESDPSTDEARSSSPQSAGRPQKPMARSGVRQPADASDRALSRPRPLR